MGALLPKFNALGLTVTFARVANLRNTFMSGSNTGNADLLRQRVLRVKCANPRIDGRALADDRGIGSAAALTASAAQRCILTASGRPAP